MKTLEDLFMEMKESAELLEEFKTVKDKDMLAAFLKKYDCAATVEDFKNALLSKNRELSDDAMEKVAGGESYFEYLNGIANNTIPIFF